jgi:myosin-5
MAHNYDVGTKAWQPDATEGWVASEVTSRTVDGDKIKLVFTLANGEASLPELLQLTLSCFGSMEVLTFESPTGQDTRDYC